MKKFSIGLLGAAMLLGACAGQQSHGLNPGLVAIHEGRYGEAEQHFAGMLAKDPNNPYAMLNLGVAQARLGKKQEAAQSYRKAIQNGENAPVRSVVRYQAEADTESTVSAIANRNLANLGS